MDKVRVFGNPASPNVFRVLLALTEKNVAYELIDSPFESDEFLKNARWGLMPCVEYKGKYYNESLAILEWLEEEFPQKPLLPKDVSLRAQVRAWLYHIQFALHDSTAKIRYQMDTSPQVFEELRYQLADMNEELKGKDFLVANQYTFADINLVAFYASLDAGKELYNVRLSDFPELERHWKALKEKDSFKKIDPIQRMKEFGDLMKDPKFRESMFQGRVKRRIRMKELRSR